MKGPFPLEPAAIDREIRPRPGAYLLMDAGEAFLFVGRADDDVAAEIKAHLGDGAAAFCVQSTDTPREAYEIECLWYHTYRPPRNPKHPVAPAGRRWPCPLCWILTDRRRTATIREAARLRPAAAPSPHTGA